MLTPNYHDNSIVNLMASITAAQGGSCTDYSPLAALGKDELMQYSKTMLLVIDGLGYNSLMKHLPDGFLARHCRTDITSTCPTTTASALTVFSSGKAPLQHGLTGWFTWLRELGAITAILPFIPRHGGTPYDQQGIPLNNILGWNSVFDIFEADVHVLYPAYIAQSHFSQATMGKAYRDGYADLDDCLGKAHDLISNKDKFYLYTYWSELDRLGHIHGINGEETIQHLIQLDQKIESFSESLPNDTLLLVTADHGLVDTDVGHTIWLHEHPILEECMTMPLSGEPRLAYCYLHPDKHDQFCRYLDEQLSHACSYLSRQQMLEKELFGIGKAHPELEHRIGDYTLLMKDNYIIKDRLLCEEEFHQIGVHGGLSDDELFVPLIVYSG